MSNDVGDTGDNDRSTMNFSEISKMVEFSPTFLYETIELLEPFVIFINFTQHGGNLRDFKLSDSAENTRKMSNISEIND